MCRLYAVVNIPSFAYNSPDCIGVTQFYGTKRRVMDEECTNALTLQNSFYPNGRASTRHRGEPQWCKTLLYITLHKGGEYLVNYSSGFFLPGRRWQRRRGRRDVQHAWNYSRRNCCTSALSA